MSEWLSLSLLLLLVVVPCAPPLLHTILVCLQVGRFLSYQAHIDGLNFQQNNVARIVTKGLVLLCKAQR
jgi:hypothetical protein